MLRILVLNLLPNPTQVYIMLSHTHMHVERTKPSLLRELDRLLLEPKSRTADEVDFKVKTETNIEITLLKDNFST